MLIKAKLSLTINRSLLGFAGDIDRKRVPLETKRGRLIYDLQGSYYEEEKGSIGINQG